jgi:hypothetical protein
MISLPAIFDSEIASAPWQAERFRLWSLLEMLRFYGAAFFTVVTGVENAKCDLVVHGASENVGAFLLNRVTDLKEEMAKLPLPISVQNRLDRIVQVVRDGMSEDRVRLILTLLGELQLDLQSELAAHLFLFIPDSRKWLFLEPEKWFGEPVSSKFPDARLSIRDCVKCLALDQWNASVFHAMSVMEHGLRTLAVRVGIALSPTFQFENWHNIIEQIESKIKAMKQLPKEQQDAVEIDFCSRAASHFFAVKEAWRNHVSHGRGKFDEEEALKIVHNVRDFMKVLI